MWFHTKVLTMLNKLNTTHGLSIKIVIKSLTRISGKRAASEGAGLNVSELIGTGESTVRFAGADQRPTYRPPHIGLRLGSDRILIQLPW